MALKGISAVLYVIIQKKRLHLFCQHIERQGFFLQMPDYRHAQIIR